MPKPTILITGSSGLIGSRLVGRFRSRHHVFALDVEEPEEQLPENAEFQEIDLTSDASVRAAVERIDRRRPGPIASVVHLAAYYDFSGEPSPLYEEVTVRGTERLLRAVRPLEPEQFVFSSTMLVHAPKEPGDPIVEDDPIEGRWDYPQSKINTEAVLRELRGDVPVVTLRIAGAYGDHGDSIPVTNQIQRIYESRLTGRVYPGDTDRGQAFVHLDDLEEAFVRTVEARRDLPAGVLPILIGEPETYGYGEIQKTLGRLLHREDWETRTIPKSVAKSGAWVQGKIPGVEEPFIKPWMIDVADDHYELDIGRARELLGWEPERRLLDTLPRMVAALRRDPREWYERNGLDAEALEEGEARASRG